MICPYYPAPFLFFISDKVPPLLYYSHVPIFIISIIVGVFILIKDRFSLLNKVLATTFFLFSLWVLCSLITWVSNSSDIIMFFWSFFGLLFVLIFFSFFRFSYIFIKNKDIPFSLYLIFFIFILPIILLTWTSFNLTGFDLVLCTSLENNYFVNYYHLIGLLTLLYIFFFLIRSYIKSEAVSKSKILLMGIGIIFFLSLFLATSFSASILKYLGLTENYQIELYGFFPIIIFIILLGYLTIKYKIFNIKLLATQALVFVMIIFIGSQFFFIKVFINFILNSITFVAIIIFGVLLIKSVKKEILQREEFVKLNIDLKKLIKQRQDLVHLVTHKVKGYFTRSKCVFAEMIEGSFGALPPKAKEMAMLGLDSDNEGINTIDIVLNAASLQAGLIKYDIKPIDFRKVVEQAIESKKDQAKIKGLKLETEIKDGNYILTGDKLWLKEVALNLVDNAVKYTNTGEITVGLELKEKQILFYVKDTGDGITDEDRKNLWTEGGRGKRSLLKNPNSTGYGLYLVKLIIEAHKGKVWEESAVGKGSIFYVKLPLNIKRLSDN